MSEKHKNGLYWARDYNSNESYIVLKENKTWYYIGVIEELKHFDTDKIVSSLQGPLNG